MAPQEARVAVPDWQRCKEVFGEVLCLPEDARRERLAVACGGDERLSRAVQELLDGHARSGHFLDPPILARSLHARLLLREEGRGDVEGTVVAGRYRLGRHIGEGASGEVRAAEDLLTGEAVACKLLRGDPGPRGEIAALRLLRIPGVVRMIEEGTEEGRPFVVTDLVAGSPFPGVPAPAPWGSIAVATVALLEILDRIHQAGFVHRDLKPRNVLVDGAGRPTVLDLGVALHPRERGRADGCVVGTPNYLPPEQLRGDAATPASDLFSVGVMLYEAVSGRLPHRTETADAMLLARSCSPPPLRELAPECPAPVADLVARLLRAEPSERPQTASEALSLLEGAAPRAENARLPWLGSDAATRAIVAAAERGESVDLAGPPGSGRSRCLAEAAERLRRAGRRVLWFRPGGGFLDLLDPAEAAACATLHDAKALARSRLERALGDGAVAFADDAGGLERWVADVLLECRAHGAVVRAVGEGPGTVRLEPLSREDLRDLFHGPDRIFHLREDAAGVLHLRSGGRPGAVAEEVAAWVRAGLARWEGGRLAMSRDAIDRLLSGPSDEPPRAVRRDLRPLPAALARLAAAVQVAGGQATPEGLSPVVREPPWQVEARLFELRTLGVVRYEAGGAAAPCAPFDVLSALTQEDVREAHAALARALPEGHEDRVRHLVAARELGAVPEEARLLARRHLDAGQSTRAVRLLEEALAAVREDSRRRDPLPLLEDLVLAGLRAWSAAPLDRALYELEMSEEQGPRVRRLAELARAGLSVLRGTWERTLVGLDRMEPFSDGRLELARQTLRVFAARRGGLVRERAAVESASEWAATCGIPAARRSLLVWLGWLRYNEGRFAEAARLHEQASALATDLQSRVASLTSRVTALMDDHRLEEARSAAAEALRATASLRDPTAEARLLSYARSIQYRLGAVDRVDEDLPDVIGRTGVRELEAVAALTEAAVAWRLGRLDDAGRLAARSGRAWRDIGMPHVACLPDALRIACSAVADPLEAREVATACARCPRRGIAIQALGLLAIARPDLSAELGIPDAWLAAVPRKTWAVRREVLSVEEALCQRVERRAPDGPAVVERRVHGEAAADGRRPP